MSDFAPILALLEKHAPPLRPKLPPAQEIRRAVVIPHLRRGGKKHPEHVVRAIYAEYQAQPSAKAAAKVFGVHRTNLTNLFKRRGLKSRRKINPALWHNGIKYALCGERYYRQTTTGKQHIALHRVIWEERHGAIPEDHWVTLVDITRPADFSESNLRLMGRSEYYKHVRHARELRRAA